MCGAHAAQMGREVSTIRCESIEPWNLAEHVPNVHCGLLSYYAKPAGRYSWTIRIVERCYPILPLRLNSVNRPPVAKMSPKIVYALGAWLSASIKYRTFDRNNSCAACEGARTKPLIQQLAPAKYAVLPLCACRLYTPEEGWRRRTLRSKLRYSAIQCKCNVEALCGLNSPLT
jgi:hypothetical protein